VPGARGLAAHDLAVDQREGHAGRDQIVELGLAAALERDLPGDRGVAGTRAPRSGGGPASIAASIGSVGRPS